MSILQTFGHLSRIVCVTQSQSKIWSVCISKLFPSPSCAVFLNVWSCMKAQLGPVRELNKYELSCRCKPCIFFFFIHFNLICLWSLFSGIFLSISWTSFPPLRRQSVLWLKVLGWMCCVILSCYSAKSVYSKNQQECDSRLLFSVFTLGLEQRQSRKIRKILLLEKLQCLHILISPSEDSFWTQKSQFSSQAIEGPVNSNAFFFPSGLTWDPSIFCALSVVILLVYSFLTKSEWSWDFPERCHLSLSLRQ